MALFIMGTFDYFGRSRLLNPVVKGVPHERAIHIG